MKTSEPIRYGECCDKCGRPKMSCVCGQKIKIGFGINKKKIPRKIMTKMYSTEEVKDFLLTFCRENFSKTWTADNMAIEIVNKWIEENL